MNKPLSAKIDHNGQELDETIVLQPKLHANVDFGTLSIQKDAMSWLLTTFNINISMDVDLVTFVGLMNSYLNKERMYLVELSKSCNSQIAYEEIEKSKKQIEQKRQFYIIVSDTCLDYYQQISEAKGLGMDMSCPNDNPFYIDHGQIWIRDVNKRMLATRDNVLTIEDILHDMSCIFSLFSSTCTIILESRNACSGNKNMCFETYQQYLEADYWYAVSSADRNLKEHNTKSKKRNYRQTVLDRIKSNPLYSSCTEYSIKTSDFAFYIANTPGISKDVVFDFLVDATILQCLDKENRYSWLKEKYHGNISNINNMLLMAFQICQTPQFALVNNRAYAVIWLWLCDVIKIAESSVENAIASYVDQMNEVTKNSLQVSSITKAISEEKKNNHDTLFTNLSFVLGVYQIEIV